MTTRPQDQLDLTMARADHTGEGTMGKISKTVEGWVLSPPQQGAPPLVTSNLELESSASHSTFETLVDLVCGPSPRIRRPLRLPGFPIMVVRRTIPARISAWAWHLSPMNFPGERHNQTSTNWFATAKTRGNTVVASKFEPRRVTRVILDLRLIQTTALQRGRQKLEIRDAT